MSCKSGLISGDDRRMTTNMFIILIDYEMTTQWEQNAEDLPDCKEIKGDQRGSPFFSLRYVLSFRNLSSIFGGKPSGCQSTTELSK